MCYKSFCAYKEKIVMSKFFDDTMVGLLEAVAIEKGEIPNEETVATFKEIEAMKNNPKSYEFYDDVDKMMKDLLL